MAQLIKNLPEMRKTVFDPCVGKIPWRRKWLPTPVFWPGEFHRLYSPWRRKESDMTEWLSLHPFYWGFPGGSVIKNPPAKAGHTGDSGSIPVSGRSPEGGNDNLLQYSCLENPMDRGASIQFSSVTRPPCSSPTLGGYLSSCPLRWWCHPTIPLSSPSPPACNLSQHQVFSNESVLHIKWPKYWSFSFSISPSNEYSGLISFRMDWLDPLAVQGTLKHLLQHHSSKASFLWRSAFFIVQLSHLYMTPGKTIALTRWTFVEKVMSLLFKMLSRLVITFLPRSKHLLISWLQSLSAVILEPQK